MSFYIKTNIEEYESTNFAKALHDPECRACKAADALNAWNGNGQTKSNMFTGDKKDHTAPDLNA